MHDDDPVEDSLARLRRCNCGTILVLDEEPAPLIVNMRSSHALAQNRPVPASGNSGAQTTPPAQDTTQASPSSEESTASLPVFAVTRVEVLHSAHDPSLAVIAVRGLTSSEGWEDGTLVPLTSGKPTDGVLDVVLVANAPQDAATPGTYAPIEAVLPVPELPFKAVRVRSASNTVTLKDLHGYAGAKAPENPCGPCVGKHFVAKGAAADQIVREEDLPPIRASSYLRTASGTCEPTPTA